MRHTVSQYLQWSHQLQTKMETSLKISIFLQFFSWAVCLHLFPPININTPIGFGFNLGAQKMFSGNSKSSRRFEQTGPTSALKECFCFPNNSENKLVTEHLQLNGQYLERLVVYFYKSNGLVQAFIPNKQKQIMIPDLSFDETNGDTLKPILLDPAVEIFDSSPSVVKNQNQIPDIEVDETNSGTLNIDSNSHSNAEDVPPVETEQETVPSETDNLLTEEDETVQPASSSGQINENIMSTDENNIPLDENAMPLGENNTPLDENNMPLEENTMPFDENNMPVDENNMPLDENNMPLDEHNMPFDQNNSPLDDHNIAPDEQGEFVVDTSPPPNGNLPIDLSLSKDLNNLRVTDQLYKIFSLLPLKTRWYLKSFFPQLQHLNLGGQNDRHYITFDDWFNHQMKGLALQNLPTSADLNTLKQRIIKLLESNGMEVSSDGMLFDPDKNVLKIANIKLRPILIGEPIQTQIKVYTQGGFKYVTSTEMSYVQLILVTFVNPPSILGVVPVGRVYLPRGLNTDPLPALMRPEDESETRSGVTIAKVGCKTCRLQDQHNQHILYSPLHGMPYFQLPLRKKINNGGQILIGNSLINPKSRNSNTHILSNSIDKDYLNNIVPRILGGFSTKKLLGDEIRHTLGGKPIITRRPIPQTYPNDLPGFRIIGGKPATSSGTPLVSKGRSGYERPF